MSSHYCHPPKHCMCWFASRPFVFLSWLSNFTGAYEFPKKHKLNGNIRKKLCNIFHIITWCASFQVLYVIMMGIIYREIAKLEIWISYSFLNFMVRCFISYCSSSNCTWNDFIKYCLVMLYCDSFSSYSVCNWIELIPNLLAVISMATQDPFDQGRLPHRARL